MDKETQRSDESIYMGILNLSHLLHKNQVYKCIGNKKKIHKIKQKTP